MLTSRFRHLAVTALLACAIPLPAPARETINFNRDWKFQPGDHGEAAQPAFDDASWSNVGLPHSFSIPYFAAGNSFYVGYGWYRKHFNLSGKWDKQRVFLDFEGAFQDAEIFVNGKKVGAHQGGYTGFEIDITDAAKIGGDNVISVRLNNLWNARLAPRAGEHTFSGGLYRNVWLIAKDPLHVAWYGTFVTTPDLSAASGKVNVKTEVTNQSTAVKTCGLRTLVVDAAGKTVASMNSNLTVPPGKTVTFDQTSTPILKPKLWSPENPALYRVLSAVSDGKTPADLEETPFGFRWIEWTADRGFFLNGQHRYLKGANVHQDHAGWGDAVTNAGAARDVGMIKDAGFDFIRGSHYPHAPAFTQACDEKGMMFWSENCFWGTGGFKGDGYWNCSAYPVKTEDQKPFEESVKASLRDMIRIHRNHPSIIIWSMSNEPFFSDSVVMPKVREFLKEVVAYSHELDPTRPAAIGGCQRGEIDKLGDVAGYNGDGARMPAYQNPGVASVVSEYGSTMEDRPGKYAPGWGDLAGTPGTDSKVSGSWRLPWRGGESIWCGFDHGSIAGRRFGAMGLVDYFRLPKRQWYWYRNEYTKVPPPEWPKEGTAAGLKLLADKTTLERVDGTDDTHLIVTVVDASGKPLSNSIPVTLTVASGPGEFPTGSSITFAPDSDITIRDGQAAIEFRSYFSGTTVIRATASGLKDATITIISKGGPAYEPGKSSTGQQRAYQRFDGKSGSEAPTVFGKDNPTRVSSEAPGHGSRMANDGDPGTFWQVANPGENDWWQADLERIVAIDKIGLSFPQDGPWRYRIEVSEDGSAWKPAVDRTNSTETGKNRSDTVSPGAAGRFVRVTFTGVPAGTQAAISEFNATGRLSQ